LLGFHGHLGSISCAHDRGSPGIGQMTVWMGTGGGNFKARARHPLGSERPPGARRELSAWSDPLFDLADVQRVNVQLDLIRSPRLGKNQSLFLAQLIENTLNYTHGL